MHHGAGAAHGAPMMANGGHGGYGASPMPYRPIHVAGTKSQVFVRGVRRRLNLVAILIALFVPWLLFCFVSALMAYNIHYRSPALCWFLLGIAFAVGVGVPALLALRAMRSKVTSPDYEPSWYIFLFLTCLLAAVLGFWAGNMCYETYNRQYYNLLNLAEYDGVDASLKKGQQVMDAGRINFVGGSKLDLGKSMGFKNRDIYCVAPIVSGTGSAPTSYDFWAVGKNCCSGVAADFHCAGFSNPRANGALRWMNDADRPFFRLAVQQAEATYHIEAQHPIFLTWEHDPADREADMQHDGNLFYFLSIGSHFALQLFLVIAASLAFSKMVHP